MQQIKEYLNEHKKELWIFFRALELLKSEPVEKHEEIVIETLDKMLRRIQTHDQAILELLKKRGQN